MNSKERFLATANRTQVDRTACWLGIPDQESLPKLFKEYKVTNLHELKLAVKDDFYSVELPYHSEVSDAIYAAFDWYQKGCKVDEKHRTLTAPGCFCDAEEIEDLDFFQWPDPSKYINPAECRKVIEQAPEDKAVLGILWSSHFQDTCAAFGMENALMNMIANPELYDAVNDRIVDFYLKANEIFYEAGEGKLDAILIGNDLGSQRGLMISPEMVRRFVIPGCKKLVAQAHSYGLKVIYHSCGSIAEVIPDLIAAGVDIIHPIQALAKGMEASTLKKQFGQKVSFCGGVDTQELLVCGTTEQVRTEVRRLKKLFPTGLILSPSHEAILPDVPPKNIRALFEEAVKEEFV